MTREKTFTITVYSDPSHSWGKIKRSVLHNLGIANNITAYSYQRGEYVYCETDVDLTTVCMALNQRNTRVKFVEKRTDRDSRIRSYERYKPLNIVDIATVAVPDSEWQQDDGVSAGYAAQATDVNSMAASRC